MNFEESYLGIIIQAYETAAMKKADSKSLKLMTIKSASDMKSIAATGKETISRFPGSKANFDENPEDAKPKSSVKIDPAKIAAMGLGLSEEDAGAFDDYLNKCFGCDLRMNMSWQFLPPDGLLGNFESMFDDVLKAMDMVEHLTKPGKKSATQICALLKLFDPFPCPQDILILLMSLKMLLFKFTSGGLKLKLDWMTLFGPIIQAIVGLLNFIVNMIFDAVSGPLDCTFASMSSQLALQRVLDPETFSTALATGNSDKSSKSQGSVLDKITSFDPSKISDAVKSSIDIPGIDLSKLTSKQSSDVPDSQLPNFYSTPTKTDTLPLPVGASLDFSISDLMESKDGAPSFLDFSLPEQLVYSVDESKRYIESLKSEILRLVNSLNGLVKTGKFFEIQNLSAAIVVLDLISVIASLLKTDLRKCDDPKEKSKLEQLVKELTGATAVEIETGAEKQAIATITNIDGSVEKVTLHSCSYGTAPVPLDEIKKILADIERLTNE